jgi:hypothetical protein
MFVRPALARAGTPTVAEQTCERACIGGAPCKRPRSGRLFTIPAIMILAIMMPAIMIPAIIATRIFPAAIDRALIDPTLICPKR